MQSILTQLPGHIAPQEEAAGPGILLTRGSPPGSAPAFTACTPRHSSASRWLPGKGERLNVQPLYFFPANLLNPSSVINTQPGTFKSIFASVFPLPK